MLLFWVVHETGEHKQTIITLTMVTMKKLMMFLKDESGATAIEYGLIAALISVAAIASMTIVGTQLSTTFSTVGSNLAR